MKKNLFNLMLISIICFSCNNKNISENESPDNVNNAISNQEIEETQDEAEDIGKNNIRYDDYDEVYTLEEFIDKTVIDKEECYQRSLKGGSDSKRRAFLLPIVWEAVTFKKIKTLSIDDSMKKGVDYKEEILEYEYRPAHKKAYFASSNEEGTEVTICYKDVAAQIFKTTIYTSLNDKHQSKEKEQEFSKMQVKIKEEIGYLRKDYEHLFKSDQTNIWLAKGTWSEWQSPKSNQASDETIKIEALQNKLLAKGYEIQVTGKLDAQSKKAINNYIKDRGYPTPTNGFTLEYLKSIGLQ